MGDDVHSFDTEEKILAALGRERYINICFRTAFVRVLVEWCTD